VQKVDDLLTKIKSSLIAGEYLFTDHAQERLQHREVTRQEVLISGFHEKRKDQFDQRFNAWKYSIKGKTLDQRPLRIIVSFDPDGMLIITIIDLNK